MRLRSMWVIYGVVILGPVELLGQGPLKVGSEVRVGLQRPTDRVCGWFVARDSTGLTLQLRDSKDWIHLEANRIETVEGRTEQRHLAMGAAGGVVVGAGLGAAFGASVRGWGLSPSEGAKAYGVVGGVVGLVVGLAIGDALRSERWEPIVVGGVGQSGFGIRLDL